MVVKMYLKSNDKTTVFIANCFNFAIANVLEFHLTGFKGVLTLNLKKIDEGTVD